MSTNDELLTEARKFLATPNLGKDMMRELDKAMIYSRRLADALEAAEARVKELETGEWEYRVRTDYGRVIAQGQFDGLLIDNSYSIERRRKAGLWQLVESEGEVDR